MRVFLMLSRDPIFKPRVFLEMVSSHDIEIVGVAEVSPMKRGGFIKKIKANIEFWGLKGFIWIGMQHMLSGFYGRFHLVPFAARWHMSIAGIAESYGISYYEVHDINKSEFKKVVKELAPDIIMSFQHQIFDGELIRLPRLAALNCHPALLPKYRGVKPLFWALRYGESEAGVSVHMLSEKIDAGAVIAHERFRLSPDLSLYMWYRIAYAVSSRVMLKAINNVRLGEGAGCEDVNDTAPYFREPKADDIDKFKEVGCRTY